MVEIVTSTESANAVTQTDAARKGAVTATPREDKPQISTEEMRQIEDFFAQLEEADAQSGVDASEYHLNRKTSLAQPSLIRLLKSQVCPPKN